MTIAGVDMTRRCKVCNRAMEWRRHAYKLSYSKGTSNKPDVNVTTFLVEYRCVNPNCRMSNVVVLP